MIAIFGLSAAVLVAATLISEPAPAPQPGPAPTTIQEDCGCGVPASPRGPR
jgi:hypothetical protein